MMKLHITAEERKIIQSILTGDYEVLVFGSRIKGDHQRYSDLDICLKGDSKVSLQEIADIKERFSQSNLPYMVDVIDYHSISDSFRKLIDTQAINFLDTD